MLIITVSALCDFFNEALIDLATIFCAMISSYIFVITKSEKSTVTCHGDLTFGGGQLANFMSAKCHSFDRLLTTHYFLLFVPIFLIYFLRKALVRYILDEETVQLIDSLNNLTNSSTLKYEETASKIESELEMHSLSDLAGLRITVFKIVSILILIMVHLYYFKVMFPNAARATDQGSYFDGLFSIFTMLRKHSFDHTHLEPPFDIVFYCMPKARLSTSGVNHLEAPEYTLYTTCMRNVQPFITLYLMYIQFMLAILIVVMLLDLFMNLAMNINMIGGTDTNIKKFLVIAYTEFVPSRVNGLWSVSKQLPSKNARSAGFNSTSGEGANAKSGKIRTGTLDNGGNRAFGNEVRTMMQTIRTNTVKFNS
ncbi:MAG: hypothetical protein MHMPM18_002587 [Marteilia pararefringens]